MDSSVVRHRGKEWRRDANLFQDYAMPVECWPRLLGSAIAILTWRWVRPREFFSVVNAVLLRPLMYKDSDNLTRFTRTAAGRDWIVGAQPTDWREQNVFQNCCLPYETLTWRRKRTERIIGATVLPNSLACWAPRLTRADLSSRRRSGGRNRVVV